MKPGRAAVIGARKLCVCFVLVVVALLASAATAQQLIGTVPVGRGGYNIAVNETTHKAYVANAGDSTVTVIDEQTFTTTTVPVTGAYYIAVDEVRDKVYVTGMASLTVIDGTTNNTTTITLPSARQLAVNSITNKIYVLSVFDAVAVVDGVTLSITTIPLDSSPGAIVLNPLTNKIYVCSGYSPTVTVIDGATNSTTILSMPSGPIAINLYTNKIFVEGATVLTVIDGATLTTQTVEIPAGAAAGIALNPLTNKIYVAASNGQNLAVVDGESLSVTTIPFGPNFITALIVEPVTNRIYFTFYLFSQSKYALGAMNGVDNTWETVLIGTDTLGIAADSVSDRVFGGNSSQQIVWIVAGPTALKFVPLTPCRVVDTRQPDGTFGGPPIQGGTYRSFPLPQGDCNIPVNSAAYSLNVTVVPQGRLGYLTVWPSGQNQPVVSTLNSPDGRTKANAAIVPAGADAAVSVYASDTTNVILDINGYFEQATNSDLLFYALAPCRVVDTRGPIGPLGGPYLSGNQERDFPVRSSDCGIPASAQAYSFNITALPHGRLGYLTVWPEGQSQPVVSTLNAPTGTATANAAVVPAGANGGIAVFPSDDTDLLIDVNGYFAPPGPGGMSLYTVQPCRVLDTRQSRGPFSGTILIDVVDSGCGLDTATAFVLNATVVPQHRLGYLTLWPTTQFQPGTSTLNAWDGSITSNMAIVANIDGWLNAFASDSTQLILDGFAYFAP